MQKIWQWGQSKLTLAVDVPLTTQSEALMSGWLSALGLSLSDVRFSRQNPDIGFGTEGQITLPSWADVIRNPKLKQQIWQATKHLKA